MVFLKRLTSGLRRLLNPGRMEQELDAEVRAYLETAVEQKVKAGMSREAALRAARLEMGSSLEAVKDRARDVGWEASVDTIWRDTGVAFRRLRKSPGFSFAAILTLALGIGGNTAVFSVLRATSLGSSAFRDPDRIVMIWSTPEGRPDVTQGTRVPEYLTWKARTQAFEHVGAVLGWASTLGSMRDGEPAERLNGWRFAASTFPALERAQTDMEAVAAQFATEMPDPQKGRALRMQPFDDTLMGSVRRLLRILQGAVGFVLLIACANVAGLLLVRAVTQHKEIAIRSSLGASRGRIVSQFLTESLVLSLVGGAVGILLAWAGLRLLVAAGPTWLSAVQNIRIDAGVLAFSTAVSVLIGVTFGLVPALQASPADLVTRLKEAAGPSIGSRGHRRIQGVLVAGQLALTLMLLVGEGLLIKSFWQLQHTDLGFQSSGVLSFQSRLPADKYFRQVSSQNGITLPDVSPVPAMLFDRVAERLRQLPGVESAGGTNVSLVPLGFQPVPFIVEGRPGADGTGARQMANVAYALVTPGYFGTMRIPILRGRDLSAADTANALPVAIINQTMARQFWPNEDPVGKQLRVAIVADLPARAIIAVVGDTPINRFDGTPTPMLYVPQLQESVRSRTPFGQSRVQMAFFLRLTQPLDVVMPAVRRAVAEVDPSLPVSQVEMVDDYLARQVEVPRQSMLLVGAFGAMALLLAMFGIYGVVAYGVVQRTREIGIRMSLGAKRSQVLALVLRQSAILTVAGMVLGLAGAGALTRLLRNLLFGLTPLDLATFVTVPLVFVVAAALASYVPARRATRVDPLVALRYE